MKRALVTLLVVLFFQGYSSAYDWTGKGFTVESKTTEEQKVTTVLKDKDGRTMTVIGPKDIGEPMVNRIMAAKEAFDKWEVIKIGTITYEVREDLVDIVLMPTELVYREQNIKETMPAGMWFSYSDTLLYNFRITRFNVLVRINGEYKDEIELLEKLLDAYKNPLAYARKRDPEYLLKRVNDLHDGLEKLQKATMALGNKSFFGSLKPIDIRVINRVIELKKGNSTITVDEIKKALKAEKLSASDKQVNLVLGVFFNDFGK